MPLDSSEISRTSSMLAAFVAQVAALGQALGVAKSVGSGCLGLASQFFHKARTGSGVELVSDEREFKCAAKKFPMNVTIHTKLVVRSDEPLQSLGIRVEASKEDDFRAIQASIKRSFVGGSVGDVSGQLIDTNRKRCAHYFMAVFDKPVCSANHEMIFSYSSKGYFDSARIEEFFQIMLPTKFLSCGFRFGPEAQYTNQRTVSVDNILVPKKIDLGNSHFSAETRGALKWAVTDPQVGAVYIPSFEVVTSSLNGW